MVKKKDVGVQKADAEKTKGVGFQKADAAKEKNTVGFEKADVEKKKGVGFQKADAEKEKNTVGFKKADEKNNVGFKKAQVKKPLARDIVADAGFEITSLTLRGRLRWIGDADSDEPGAAGRRSISGGIVGLAGWCVLILLLAGCGVLSYARTQASCATSSCEAELYALGSCAAEAHQLASLLAKGWGCGAALGLQRQQQCADLGGAKRTRPPLTRRDQGLERGRPATVRQRRHYVGQLERLAYEVCDTFDD